MLRTRERKMGTMEAMEENLDQFSSVAQSCLTLCDPMNRSTPGLPVHHQLPEFTQTHVHWVGDGIQPSHPLLSPSPPAPNPSQHQGLFQWVNSSHEENYRYQGNVSCKDGLNKGQKWYGDLTEAEDIKKRWQEYTELYKKWSSWPR